MDWIYPTLEAFFCQSCNEVVFCVKCVHRTGDMSEPDQRRRSSAPEREGLSPSKAGVPATVAYPDTSMLSFTGNARPQRGPTSSPLAALPSIAFASASTCQTKLCALYRTVVHSRAGFAKQGRPPGGTEMAAPMGMPVEATRSLGPSEISELAEWVYLVSLELCIGVQTPYLMCLINQGFCILHCRDLSLA